MEYCEQCEKLITEPCEHIKEIVDINVEKRCKICNTVKKLETDFYYRTLKNGTKRYQPNCKACVKAKSKERNDKTKSETYHCVSCNKDILNRNKAAHLRSLAHREKCTSSYDEGFKDGKKAAYKELKPIMKKLVKFYKSLKDD